MRNSEREASLLDVIDKTMERYTSLMVMGKYKEACVASEMLCNLFQSYNYLIHCQYLMMDEDEEWKK